MTRLILGTPIMLDFSGEPTVDSLIMVNRSLRRQVVDLLLSIAILKEDLAQLPLSASSDRSLQAPAKQTRRRSLR